MRQASHSSRLVSGMRYTEYMEASEQARLVLDAKAVARELGCSRQHVHNLRKAGLLPATAVARGPERIAWRWVRADIDAFLDRINDERAS
jgi:predicted DNA-binding transcriptional regulator AlpA